MVEAAGVSASEQPVSRRLPAKLAAILSEVQRIKQSGSNPHFGYKYATESDVFDAIRPLMGKHGVAFYTTIVKIEKLEQGGQGGLTRVWITALFFDETETIPIQWVGDGQGCDDKAVSKALTAAVKSLLVRTFLVSSGDDAEATAGAQPERKAAPKPPAAKPNESARQPTPIRPAAAPPVQTPNEPAAAKAVTVNMPNDLLFTKGITDDDRAIYVEAATTLFEADTLAKLQTAWESIEDSKGGFPEVVYKALGRLGVARRDALKGPQAATGTTNGG